MQSPLCLLLRFSRRVLCCRVRLILFHSFPHVHLGHHQYSLSRLVWSLSPIARKIGLFLTRGVLVVVRRQIWSLWPLVIGHASLSRIILSLIRLCSRISVVRSSRSIIKSLCHLYCLYLHDKKICSHDPQSSLSILSIPPPVGEDGANWRC